MAMTLEHFVAQLDESGVISAVDIAAFQKSQSPAAESAEDLAKLLVKHKKVTKLQAQLVYQGKGNRLLLAGCPEMKSSGIAIKPGNLKNLTAAFQIEVSRPRGWKLGRRRGFGGL